MIAALPGSDEKSLPSLGAWIETIDLETTGRFTLVAPFIGSVD